MKNAYSKINKLIRALELEGKIYLINKEQFYNSESNRRCTINKLSHLMPVEEYNKLFPDNKKNPKKYTYVKLEVFKSYRKEEILIMLAKIYNEVGVADG